MFRIVVPVAPHAVAGDDQAPVTAIVAGELAGIRVVVVEDDSAVREASVALLRQWGCHPVSFASMSEVVASGPTWDRAPDLLLSDFRLPEGRDGIALVEWLREEFNREIPALLATGDTALGLDRGALPPRVVVLHKPIAAATLFDALVALRSLPIDATELQSVQPPC